MKALCTTAPGDAGTMSQTLSSEIPRTLWSAWTP